MIGVLYQHSSERNLPHWIAADISHQSLKQCHDLFGGFCSKSTSLSLCYYVLVCEANITAILRAFVAGYYL